MNVCGESVIIEFKAGNLYMVRNPSESVRGVIFMYTSLGNMVNLTTGGGASLVTNRSLWTDVTDQYCLQKVK